MVMENANEVDEDVEATVDTKLVNDGMYTRNERRTLRGDDPRPEPEADMLTVTTPQGAIPLSAAIQAGVAATLPKPAAPGAPAKPASGNQSTTSKKPPASAGKSALGQLQKATPTITRARRQIEHKVAAFLRDTASDFAGKLTAHHTKVRKAIDDEVDDPDELLRLLTPRWRQLAQDLQDDFVEIAQEGGRLALSQLNIDDSDMISGVNQVAAEWAKGRAAEMVGMRRTADGTLVTNPDARWAISDTTRDEVRRIVEAAFENKTTIKQLAEQIKQAGTFSESRAKMIAETEASLSESQGNLKGWKESGIVETIAIEMSADHDEEDECDDASSDGPYELDAAPMVPLHPRCRCAYRLESIKKVSGVQLIQRGDPRPAYVNGHAAV
jgi:hypothetical protein